MAGSTGVSPDSRAVPFKSGYRREMVAQSRDETSAGAGGKTYATHVTKAYGGVETGGTWTVCALGTNPDNIVARETFPTADPGSTLTRIVDFFRRHERPEAIGIGSFGPVDLDPDSPSWGEVTSTPKPGWQHTPVAGVIARELDVPVRFDTDVTAAAIGEYRWGAGRDAASLVYLTVGTGIGAGLLLGGQPWHGLVHPEVGHMRIPHDRDADPFDGICPLHGDCLEGLATGAALAERWGQPAEQLPADHPGWELEASYLALGILNIVLTVSPHRVIVGGGVLEHPGLLAAVRSRVRALLGGYLEAPLLLEEIDRYLVAPGLGDDAGVLGAIAMAAAGSR
jgi:fructokinase